MTDISDTKLRGIPIRGGDRLIVAIDITGSMNLPLTEADARSGARSRMSYAKELLSDLIRRLPRDSYVTVLTVGADVRELAHNAPPIQARSALLLADSSASLCKAGLALERCFTGYLQRTDHHYERANFVLVTDGEPDDGARWQAWELFNAKHGAPLTITVLTCGELDSYNVTGGRDIVTPLELAEFQIATPTGSDRPGLSTRDTAPPSLSPPELGVEGEQRAKFEPTEIATDATHIHAHGDHLVHESEGLAHEPDPAHSPEAHARAEHEDADIREHAKQADEVKRDQTRTEHEQRKRELAGLTPEQVESKRARGEVAPGDEPAPRTTRDAPDHVTGYNARGEPVAHGKPRQQRDPGKPTEHVQPKHLGAPKRGK